MSMSGEVIFSVGTYSDVLRVAPVVRELQREESSFVPRIVFQGCIEDLPVDDPCFQALCLPPIDACLGVRAGSPGFTMARTCEAFEQYLLARDLCISGVMVMGESDGSMACTLAASKLHIPVACLDAGLRRSDGLRVRGELNRMVTDQVADLLLVSEPHSLHRLRKEGIPSTRIRYVGNVLIDSLKELVPRVDRRDMQARLHLDPKFSGWIVIHLTRSEFLFSQVFVNLLELLQHRTPETAVIVLADGQALAGLREGKYYERVEGFSNVVFFHHREYLDYLGLLSQARLVLSDHQMASEECAYTGVPCLLLSNYSIRPTAVIRGTTFLAGDNWKGVVELVDLILLGGGKRKHIIEGWDGNTASRILEHLENAWKTESPTTVPVPVCVA